ncbi:reverse transcriptase domain-containing protein [Tanacetum coccineum]
MINKIQSLNKKLTTLSHFLSKGADKTLPLMKTLKSCTSEKTFQWITEAEEAFKRMKEFIEVLPTVTAPIKGEALVMYLAASEESISAVLLAERGKKQIHVYFVSRNLQGAEIEYPKLEKLILALIYVARRLRRLAKSGRIAKWAIELGEHEIEFKGQNSVKGLILADFLAETTSTENEEVKGRETKRKEPDPEDTWKLFTNGASSSAGSRAGLMLSTHCHRNGNPRAFHFRRFTVGGKSSQRTIRSKATRHKNKKADALSKLASMTFSKLAKEVLVEVIQEKSIVQKEVANVIKEEEDN